MPAYLRAIEQWGCQECGKLAEVEVRNTWNALVGRYCGSCGKRKVKQLNEGAQA